MIRPMIDGTVVFAGHGAERTGPPIGLLHLLRWVREHTDLDVAVVLLEGGPLLDDYQDVAPVWVLDEWDLPPLGGLELAVAARAGGDRWAAAARRRALRRRLRDVPDPALMYVNTAWTIRVLPYLGSEAPVFTTVHELSVGLDHHLQAPERDLLLGRTHHFFAVADAVATELVEGHGVAPDRVSVHREMIEVEPAPPDDHERWAAEQRRRLGIPPGAAVVGASGLTHWRKGADLFVLLAEQLRASRPDLDVHLVWVGGEGEVEGTRRLFHDVGRSPLADRVHVVAHQDRPLDWFRLFDMMVLTAREDAFPLVCLEAASVGVPLVCFDTGGMPELVRDADAGAVVPFPDVAAMARAVEHLVEDEGARHAAGERARGRVVAEHDVAVRAPVLVDELVRRWREVRT